jgi:hypothetical protein
MIQKIKRYLLMAASTLMLLLPAAVPVAVHAADGSGCGAIGNQVASGASSATPGGEGGNIDCTSDGTDGTNGIGKLAKNIVNVFSFIVGAVAVIMIIYGGFRYITSGGDSNSVGSAKNTLIYAIIGLVIVALAQLIVQFVLTQSSEATSA